MDKLMLDGVECAGDPVMPDGVRFVAAGTFPVFTAAEPRTLRDEFAMAAAGYLATWGLVEVETAETRVERAADLAYLLADAMLERRKL